MIPLAGFFVAPRDAGGLQGARIRPPGVTVVGDQVRRAIGHQRIQQLARRHRSAERLVVPAPPGDPLALRMRLRPDANRVLDVLEGLRVSEADLIERQAAADQVRVRVVEAGHHRAALGVDHDGLRALEPLDLAVRPDADHLVAAHGDGLRELVALGRVDVAVDHDEIDRPVVFALRADDESCDDRDADDERHGVSREAGRHCSKF